MAAKDIISRAPNSASIQAASTNNPRTLARSLGRGQSNGGGGGGATPNLAALPTDQYTQLQWNFSLFWGLAIQAYELTLHRRRYAIRPL